MTNDENRLAETVTPELIRAGEISMRLTRKLSEASRELTDVQVYNILKACESSRVDFTVNALRLGLVLLAKKIALPHGEFQAAVAKWRTSAVLETSDRQLRVYRQLAKLFLSQLERGDFREELATKDLQTIPVLQDGNINALIERDNFQRELRRFVGNRGVDRLLKDLNAAKKAAEAEELREKQEAEEAAAQQAAAETKEGPPAPPLEKTTEQLILNFKTGALKQVRSAFDTFAPDAPSIQKDPAVVAMTADDWQVILDQVEAEARKIEAHIERLKAGAQSHRAAFKGRGEDLLA